MIIQSVGVNVAPFDRNSLLKNDSEDMRFYEDLTNRSILARRAIRSTIVMPIDQVKDETKRLRVQQKTIKEFSFYFYKSDSLDLIQQNGLKL
jgi:hypothetical protein